MKKKVKKLVLAKGLATTPLVLLLEEPTRGVDVATRFELYTLLNELAMPWASPITAGALANDDLRRAPLASGPYELVEWDEGRQATLRRRANYPISAIARYRTAAPASVMTVVRNFGCAW